MLYKNMKISQGFSDFLCYSLFACFYTTYRFWPAFEVRSTQMLAKISSKPYPM